MDYTPELNLRDMVAAFWRRKWLFVIITLLSVLSGIAYILLQPTEYAAHALVQMNAREENIVDVEAVVGNLNNNRDVVQSEVDFIQSTAIAQRVVNRLDLVNNATFNPMLAEPNLKDKLLGNEANLTTEQQLRAATLNLQKRYNVTSAPKSLTINITTRMPSAELSADVANAIAEEYLADQLEVQYEKTDKANAWLTNQLTELKSKLQQQEQAVQNWREKNGLTERKDGLTLTGQQLSELSTQLIMARTQRAEAQAKLRQAQSLMRSGGTASAAEVLNSNLIQRLREQEAEVRREEADLATRYGPRHPQMQKVRAELEDLQDKIAAEIRHIIASYENDVAIARSRESELKSNLSTVERKDSRNSAAEVQLAELERERDTTRQLYQSFLSRSKETAQQRELSASDARLAARAQVPLKAAYPQKSLILAIALVLGLILGTLAVFILEQLDNGFRTAEALEKALNKPVIGRIPYLKAAQSLIPYLKNKPTSAFAESVRNILTSLHFMNPDKPAKVVLVTSATVGEGKSSVACTIAALAAQGGKKVLIMDADMRRPRVANVLGAKPMVALHQLLTEDGHTLAKSVAETDIKNLHVLGAKADTPHSNELLGSQKMAKLLETAKKSYDMIVLDTPPVSAVTDAITLSARADAAVFVVKWADTPKDLVQQTIQNLEKSKVPMAGLVLNQVNVAKEYGGYSYAYHKAKKYYSS